MRIGIDFDNTIACYDTLFHQTAININLMNPGPPLNKVEVKKQLLTTKDGDQIWQRLQGQVYGRFIEGASIFPGLGRFLLRAKWAGDKVFIISHKSEYGHFDETRTPLRSASFNWMENRGFFKPEQYNLSTNNVFFENTRAKKVDRITALNLDVMIDDLFEVFQEPHFPKIKTYLFGSDRDTNQPTERWTWKRLSIELFGPETNEFYLQLCQHLLTGNKIEKIEKINGGRNSNVFNVTTQLGPSYIAKFYPDRYQDPRPRLLKESAAFELTQDIQNEIKPVQTCSDLDIGIYSRVEGKKIIKPTDFDIQEMMKFIDALHQLSSKTAYATIGLATESCLTYSDLISQIDKRIASTHCCDHPMLNDVMSKLLPIYENVSSYSLSNWPKSSLTLPLEKEKLLLSPSDFGFHNALKTKSGKIIFLDFEYFGWDDPVKLCIDTMIHPGMNLSNKHKINIFKHFTQLFRSDNQFNMRFKAAWPLYLLRWSLIILNPFHQLDKEHVAKEEQEFIDSVLETKHKSAVSMLKYILDYDMECPYV